MKVKIINLILLTSCFLLPVIPVLAQPTTPSAPVDGGFRLWHKKDQREKK